MSHRSRQTPTARRAVNGATSDSLVLDDNDEAPENTRAPPTAALSFSKSSAPGIDLPAYVLEVALENERLLAVVAELRRRAEAHYVVARERLFAAEAAARAAVRTAELETRCSLVVAAHVASQARLTQTEVALAAAAEENETLQNYVAVARANLESPGRRVTADSPVDVKRRLSAGSAAGTPQAHASLPSRRRARTDDGSALDVTVVGDSDSSAGSPSPLSARGLRALSANTAGARKRPRGSGGHVDASLTSPAALTRDRKTLLRGDLA